VAGRQLIDDRGEWQQRIRAVLYHHGIRHRPDLVLLRADGHAWLEQAPLPETAGEQVTVALGMIDALDRQLPSLDRQLGADARRQVGCQALIDAYYGIGELTAVTIVAELGDCRRLPTAVTRSATAAWTRWHQTAPPVAGDFGLCGDVGRVRDPRAAFAFDVGAERDLQAVGVAAAGGELAVADPVVDRVG
jgi:hypothetical protein